MNFNLDKYLKESNESLMNIYNKIKVDMDNKDANKNLTNLLKKKVDIKTQLLPISKNEEGSYLFTLSSFWMVLCEIKIDKTNQRQQDFLTLINTSLTYDLSELENYYKYFIEKCDNLFKPEEAVNLMKISQKEKPNILQKKNINLIREHYIDMIPLGKKFVQKINKVDLTLPKKELKKTARHKTNFNASVKNTIDNEEDDDEFQDRLNEDDMKLKSDKEQKNKVDDEILSIIDKSAKRIKNRSLKAEKMEKLNKNNKSKDLESIDADVDNIINKIQSNKKEIKNQSEQEKNKKNSNKQENHPTEEKNINENDSSEGDKNLLNLIRNINKNKQKERSASKNKNDKKEELLENSSEKNFKPNKKQTGKIKENKKKKLISSTLVDKTLTSQNDPTKKVNNIKNKKKTDYKPKEKSTNKNNKKKQIKDDTEILSDNESDLEKEIDLEIKENKTKQLRGRKPKTNKSNTNNKPKKNKRNEKSNESDINIESLGDIELENNQEEEIEAAILGLESEFDLSDFNIKDSLGISNELDLEGLGDEDVELDDDLDL